MILSTEHTLHVSLDAGVTWMEIASSVFKASWDPINSNILYYTKQMGETETGKNHNLAEVNTTLSFYNY